MTVCAIHQPNFAPWFGYFVKIALSDRFVFLDNVLFSKGSVINRVKIKKITGDTHWLTVPLPKKGLSHSQIKDVTIRSPNDFFPELLNRLEDYYHSAPHKTAIVELFREVAGGRPSTLVQLNTQLVRYICRYADIQLKPYFASELGSLPDSPSERLAEICMKLDACCYLCGYGSVNYQSHEPFAARGIAVKRYRFEEPAFSMNNESSEPGLSVLERIAYTGFDGLANSVAAVVANIQTEVVSH